MNFLSCVHAPKWKKLINSGSFIDNVRLTLYSEKRKYFLVLFPNFNLLKKKKKGVILKHVIFISPP